MASPQGPLPPVNTQWIDRDGSPSLSFRQYFLPFDAVVRGLMGFFGAATFATSTTPGTLINAVDDAHAQLAGVAIGQLYRNGSVVQIRVT